MPRFDSLPAWLAWQETLHPKKIDLGLTRIAAVADRLELLQPGYGVVTVAGTNGKGSSVAMLAAILEAAGYRVGAYTSPHLLHYNERIRCAGREAQDGELCAAFEQIDRARAGVTLSYFEFGTLAALYLFRQAALDLAILEVGLGGRLDAVNIIDPDVALVTAIDIDHSDWLGPDRESIGREKAGIFRAGRAAVCADPAPPASLEDTATALGARWHALGRQFGHVRRGAGWDWQGVQGALVNLPAPALAGSHQYDNASGVLMVLELLRERYPVSRQAVEHGLRSVTLAGRFQAVPGPVRTLLDVAHNPASGRHLARMLAAEPAGGRTWLVLGMLKDKDVSGFVQALAPVVDEWCLAGLDGERGLSASELRKHLPETAARRAQEFPNVTTARDHAYSLAARHDRVVICGSFVTVAKALASHV